MWEKVAVRITRLSTESIKFRLGLELQVRHLKIPKKIKLEIKFEPYMSVKKAVLKLRFCEKTENLSVQNS